MGAPREVQHGVALSLLALTLGVGCSSEDALPEVDDPSSVDITAGPDEVFVELGSYNIGENLEGFVSGPDLVIYGDGSVYRDTVRLAPDAPTRFQRGVISRARLVDMVAASDDLPDSVDGPGCAEDEAETELVVDDRAWSACGILQAAEFGPFLEAVQNEVESLDLTEWQPTAIVAHASVYGPCAVIRSSSLPVAFTAPVYPHVTDRFPLGAFDCPSG